MKKKSFKTILMTLTATFTLSFALMINVNAAELNHAYSVQKLVYNNYGGGFTSRTDPSKLGASTDSIITHEMWLSFSNGGWIETGATCGKFNDFSGKFTGKWNGNFAALQYTANSNDYREFTFGSNNGAPSLNKYEIKCTSIGSHNWAVYINSQIALTTNGFAGGAIANGMIVGVEESDGGCSYPTGMYSEGMYMTDFHGTKYNWTATGIKEHVINSDIIGQDYNYSDLIIHSGFNSAYNTISYWK